MESFTPANYLPEGRANPVEGFGYVTNKTQYNWLQDNALAQKRHDDLVKQVYPSYSRHVREFQEKIKKDVNLYNYRERILNSRPISEFGLDPLFSETKHQTIYKMQL